MTWGRLLTCPAATRSFPWDACTSSGFPGWVVWLFIHIGFLTGFRNRLGALVSWWPAFIRDMRRERTYTTERVGLDTQCVRRAASRRRWHCAAWQHERCRAPRCRH